MAPSAVYLFSFPDAFPTNMQKKLWLELLTPGTEGTACCSVFCCVKGKQQAPGGCFHVNFHVSRRLNDQNSLVLVVLLITDSSFAL